MCNLNIWEQFNKVPSSPFVFLGRLLFRCFTFRFPPPFFVSLSQFSFPPRHLSFHGDRTILRQRAILRQSRGEVSLGVGTASNAVRVRVCCHVCFLTLRHRLRVFPFDYFY